MCGFISGFTIRFHCSPCLFLWEYFVVFFTIALWYTLKLGMVLPLEVLLLFIMLFYWSMSMWYISVFWYIPRFLSKTWTFFILVFCFLDLATPKYFIFCGYCVECCFPDFFLSLSFVCRKAINYFFELLFYPGTLLKVISPIQVSW